MKRKLDLRTRFSEYESKSDNLSGFVLHTSSLFRFCVLFEKINLKGFI